MFASSNVFLDFNLPNATTWFYFSLLLAVALFFKFSRLLSVRNLDILTLFFVVPGRRKFVVLGDVGIHEKVGQDFWEHVTAAVSERFREGDLTGGLVHGIQKVGEQLARYFPFDPGAAPGLPNTVDIS